MTKKTKNENPDAHYEFDLQGSTDSTETLNELRLEKQRLEKMAFNYESIIRKNGLAEELGKEFSDEEYICVKGIETIKMLVMNQIATKDDINMFDILYRNLNTIRGIKVGNVKKEKPKTAEELRKLLTIKKVD